MLRRDRKLGVSGTTSSSEIVPEYIGDGQCDGPENKEEFGYDGGDCCWCTCTDGAYSCDSVEYDCKDPDASCPECVDKWIGDGRCDRFQNTETCYYDGGDCCPCTCEGDGYYECGFQGYDCKDPAAECNVRSSTFTSWYTSDTYCFDEFYGDGYCDEFQNYAHCDFDGGDCCTCTCTDGSIYKCGYGGYDCKDEEAGCTTSSASQCIEAYIGDGFCDAAQNIAECEYDGGDCCAITCVDGSAYECGYAGYNCLDPNPEVSSPAPTHAPTSTPTSPRTPLPTPSLTPGVTPPPTPGPTPYPTENGESIEHTANLYRKPSIDNLK